jgi:hypothetical protein
MPTGSLLEIAAVSRTGRVVTAEQIASSGFMPPLHAHAADEAIYLVEGRLTVFAGADVVTLGEGEAFVVAEGVKHTFRVDSSRARMVFSTFAASAGRYEDFLRATGPVIVGPSGAAVWAGEDARAVGAVAAAAGISVHGPPGLMPTDAEIAAQAA